MTSQLKAGGLGNMDFATMEQWARFWEIWFSWSFLRGYVATAKDAPCLPKDREELKLLLDAFVMEKAVYELGYELDNRPEWVFLPLNGIAHALGIKPASPELNPLAARGLPDHG
jgi:maltose alpha-D-glucosyltransferase / alpha-amylase